MVRRKRNWSATMPNKKAKRSERELTAEEQRAMRKAIAAASKFLNLKPGCSVQKIQESIFATMAASSVRVNQGHTWSSVELPYEIAEPPRGANGRQPLR